MNEIDWRSVQKLRMMERVERLCGQPKRADKIRKAWLIITGGIELQDAYNGDNGDNGDNVEEPDA